MKQYEPLVHKRVIQLSEALVQRGRVDLAELIGYFAFVPFSIIRSKTSVTPSQTDLTSWQTWGKCLGMTLSKITRRLLGFRLGGGTDMIREGDPQGFWPLLEGGMR